MAETFEETDQQNNEREDLWSGILEDVSVSSDKGGKKISKNILVLGDVCSGKSTLIDLLCSLNTKKLRRNPSNQSKYLLSGCSLEYRFIDVRDEETDDYFARLSVWNLDGVVWHSQLLPFVLNEKNVEDTLVMIVIDLSKPWSVMESLEKWTEVINKHINTLKLSEKQRKRMNENIIKAFQSYIDPEVDTANITEGDDVTLPLEDNVLTCNFGIPITVVCTKSDSFTQLEKNEKYQDEHFDFIQQHIRRFCLNYGAALFYTSTKDAKNVDILYKYLVHRIYGLKFNTPANIIERDSVFIPSGWDSNKKISLLCEQIKHFNFREPLKNIIVPPREQKTLHEQEAITSEDDQVFLLAQQAHLAKSPRPQTTTPVTASATKERSPRLPGTSPQDPEPSKLISSATGSGTSSGGGEVLASFFNNLLAKKGTSKPSRSAPDMTQNRKPLNK